MNNFVKLNEDEKIVTFTRTAEKMKLKPFIIEKDFWVCFMLDHLFNDSKFTILSK